MHLVGILFPHVNDDARSKPHQTQCRVKVQNKLSEPINIANGVRQGKALACLLFNVDLEKVIRDAAVNKGGTIFYKSVQILAYADCIDIIGRTQ